MSRLTKPTKPGSWGGVSVLPNKINRKKMPNGLRALLKIISYGWQSDEKGTTEKRTLKEFVAEITEFYEKAYDEYGVSEFLNLESHISKLHTAQVHINFIDLKAHADYIGVPSGILLLIAQMAGDELIDGNRTLNSFKEKMDRAANLFATIKTMIDKKEDFLIEHKKFDAEANVIGLKLDEYNLHRLIYIFYKRPENIREKKRQ